MPRISKVDACMICESIPCTCFEKPKVVKAKASKPKPAVPVVDAPSVPTVPSNAPRVSARDRMRAAASAPPPPPTAPPPAPVATPLAPPKISAPKPAQVDLDVETKVSIRILNKLGMLGADERRKYSGILTREPDVAERAAHWRRHRA